MTARGADAPIVIRNLADMWGLVDSHPPTMRRLMAATILAEEFRMRVFPLAPGSKIPFPRSRGFKDATTDVDRIAWWWHSQPESNIGIATGEPFDVLDIDRHKVDGHASFRKLPPTLVPGIFMFVRTPNDGLHAYCMASGTQRNNANAATGLDIRGIGGYVVGPGSTCGGRDYRPIWADPTRYGHGLLDYSAILAELGQSRPTAPTSRTHEFAQPVRRAAGGGPSVKRLNGVMDRLLSASEGERNNLLWWAAKQFVDEGVDPVRLTDIALGIGLEPHEVYKTINSARSGAA